MASIATGAEITPPIKIPEVIKPTAPPVIPPENPTAILGIIDEHPIPPGTPDGVLHMIAEADLSKKAASPEQPAAAETDHTSVTPEPTEQHADGTHTADAAKPEQLDASVQKQDEHAPETPAEAATEEAKPDTEKKKEPGQETETPPETTEKNDAIKQTLKELGQELVTAKDKNATLVSLALSMGDTPMANEFREETLRYLLTQFQPESVSDATWNSFKSRLPEKSSADMGTFRKFLRHENIPPEILDHPDTIPMMNSLIHEKNNKGLRKNHLTDRAMRLRNDLGWTEDHPMPETPKQLSETLGEDATGDRQTFFQDEMKRENMERQKLILTERIRSLKGKAPTMLFIALMGTSFLSQLAQESNPRQ